MAACTGTHTFDVDITTGWFKNDTEARTAILHMMREQGATHLKCDGTCEDKDQKCNLTLEVPEHIRTLFTETFDWPDFKIVTWYRASFKGKVTYRASFKGKVTVICECGPKDKH